jgi:ribosomal protein L37E
VMEEKLYISGVDPEQERCLRCGSMFLDTGWECTDCGYDNLPHYSQQNAAQGGGVDRG